MHAIDNFQILTLPGWQGSDADHWQSHWERAFPNAKRVEQADWNRPVYAEWAARLSAEVAASVRPVLLVAHSLGTSLAMRWAQDGASRKVVGAFLVAPSDRDRFERPGEGPQGFAPMILAPLPFRSMVLASRTDERVAFERAEAFARAWRADFVDVGDRGHIGAAAGLGAWPQGLVWLGQFIATLPGFDGVETATAR